MVQKPSVHCFGGQKACFSRRASGFTLIELLVTVGIIALLLSIGAAAAVKINAEARREQVRRMMDGLIGANDEFKAVRQQGNVNHSGNFPINWSDPANQGGSQSSSERFVSAISTVQVAQVAMMAALNSSTDAAFAETYRDKDSDGHSEIYDRWGTALQYRSFNDGTGVGPGPADYTPPGTSTAIIVPNNLLPLSRSPIFVSAGGDETFGTDDDITTLNSEPVYAP